MDTSQETASKSTGNHTLKNGCLALSLAPCLLVGGAVLGGLLGGLGGAAAGLVMGGLFALGIASGALET